MITPVLAQIVNDSPARLEQLTTVFENVVKALIPLAGIVLFIVLILGGYQYITAGGDAKKAAAAQQTLTYAILGIVLVAMAFLIIRLIATFTGVEGILNFRMTVPSS